MSRAALRQSLIANNLSNVNTPGYKRLDLQFAQELAGASARVATAANLQPDRTNGAHLAARASEPDNWQVVEAEGTAMRQDGNNVDIEVEMALLAENSLYYQALVRDLNNRLAALRAAVTEGRR